MAELVAKVLECPQCGAPVKPNSKTCDRCYSQYIITSVSSLKKFDDSAIKKYLSAYESSLKSGGESAELFTAMGICQLQRGLYKFANNYFDKAIALLPEEGETYYYAALALLNGKRPFLSSLPVIKKATEYLQLAAELSGQGSYYYLHHLIHKDYYEKRKLKCSPTSAELLEMSLAHGLSDADSDEIHRLVGLEPVQQ